MGDHRIRERKLWAHVRRCLGVAAESARGGRRKAKEVRQPKTFVILLKKYSKKTKDPDRVEGEFR